MDYTLSCKGCTSWIVKSFRSPRFLISSRLWTPLRSDVISSTEILFPQAASALPSRDSAIHETATVGILTTSQKHLRLKDYTLERNTEEEEACESLESVE